MHRFSSWLFPNVRSNSSISSSTKSRFREQLIFDSSVNDSFSCGLLFSVDALFDDSFSFSVLLFFKG